VGDEVKSGDILAEVETDKATMELEAYEDGILLYIGVKEGDSVAVDGILAVIGEKGADFESLIKSQESKKATPAKEISEEPVATTDTDISKSKDTVISPSTEGSNGRIIASPLAKKLAREKGYDLKQIQGSGDNGRIINSTANGLGSYTLFINLIPSSKGGMYLNKLNSTVISAPTD